MLDLIAKGKIIEGKKFCIYDYISENKDNPQKIQESIEELRELGKKTLDIYNLLLDGIIKLKETNAQLEEKILEMAEKLDEFTSNMLVGDYKMNKKICEQKYSSIWNTLNEESQNFLITSNFLHKMCVFEQLDFSPIIIELSRIYENELLEKIFLDFVNRKAKSAIMLQPDGKNDALYKAVNNAKNETPFFISLTQMIKIINRLQDHQRGTYGDSLKTELSSKWNIVSLVDTDFYNKGITLAVDYRNRAAHPGIPLTKNDAENCDCISQSLLEHFVNSIK